MTLGKEQCSPATMDEELTKVSRKMIDGGNIHCVWFLYVHSTSSFILDHGVKFTCLTPGLES